MNNKQHHIICPHCYKEQDDTIGSLGDISVEAFIKCEHCNESFKISITNDELTVEGM